MIHVTPKFKTLYLITLVLFGLALAQLMQETKTNPKELSTFTVLSVENVKQGNEYGYITKQIPVTNSGKETSKAF